MRAYWVLECPASIPGSYPLVEISIFISCFRFPLSAFSTCGVGADAHLMCLPACPWYHIISSYPIISYLQSCFSSRGVSFGYISLSFPFHLSDLKFPRNFKSSSLSHLPSHKKPHIATPSTLARHAAQSEREGEAAVEADVEADLEEVPGAEASLMV